MTCFKQNKRVKVSNPGVTCSLQRSEENSSFVEVLDIDVFFPICEIFPHVEG